MKSYPKVAIVQVSTDGTARNTRPTPTMMNNWITSWGSATATGLDPSRKTTPIYIRNSGGKWGSAVPHNIIIDAKTRKILAKGISPSSVPAEMAKYGK